MGGWSAVSPTPAKIHGFPSIYLLTGPAVLSTANITMQFGPKPLFENISVKFGEGNRYGLIGANGCGKSTFMKILGGDLEPSAGNVALEPNIRLGKLRQDQFAYEDVRVLDVVMMGHTEMWAAMTERDAIYANPDATDDDYMHAAELEGKFAEYGGYDAEARAGALLLGIGIDEKFHNGPMRDVAPGWKLRVLLAHVSVLEARRAAARRTVQQPRHQLDPLARAHAQRVQLDDDHHLARSSLPELGVHAHGRHGLRHAEGLAGQLRRLHARIRAGARASGRGQCAGEGARRRAAGLRAPFLGEQVEGAPGDESREADRQDQDRGIQAFVAPEPVHPLRVREEAAQHRSGRGRHHEEIRPHDLRELQSVGAARRAYRDHRRERRGQDDAAACAARQPAARRRHGQVGRERERRLYAAGHVRGVPGRRHADGLDRPVPEGRRRRDDGARHARPPAVLGRRHQEVGEGAVGRREGPHDLGQADARPPQRAADGRADEPHGHGVDRIAADRAREVRRHADLRVARP
ncbi:ATPase component of ABC transporter [Burkholderia dolosa AU0158]|nr:ATPase component of ABC transporter [Burkholderia dolosa AU0158]